MRRVLLAGLVMGCVHAAFGQTQLIVNGGFESGSVNPWVLASTTTGPNIFNAPLEAHSGAQFLSMGQSAGTDQVAYQTITIPSNAIAAQLSFFWNSSSTDPSSTVLFRVGLFSTNGNFITNAMVVANAFNTSTPYQGFDFDLEPFAGQSVRVLFEVAAQTGINGGATTFRVDDVSAVYITTNDLPRNDHFTNRFTLTGSAVNTTATNSFATKEPGEPNHAGHNGGRSLWWTWTPPTNGVVTISTIDSTFDTLLAVYTGSASVSNLTLLKAHDNLDATLLTSRVKFGATAGTPYQIAVDGRGGASGVIALHVTFVPDTTPPAVSFTSPAANAKVTNSTIVVQGKATDTLGVTQVEFRLENAAGTNSYQVADGTNLWSATVTDLVPGINTVRVRAFDTSSNLSATVTRSFNYVIVSPLTLTTDGGGTVTPDLNGQLLEIGANYTVTAKPGLGQIFADWTGDLTAATPVLTFTMQSNLVLQANFIPNPFGPVAGVYQGLFYDTTGVAHESSGFFNAKLTGTGKFTAKLLIAGLSASLSGQFSATGTASNSITRKAPLPPVSVQLQLDLGGGGITGQLTDGSWTAELNAHRATFSATTNLAPQAGRYTLVIPGDDDGAEAPGGEGFGTVLVSTAGTVTFAGTLADGTKAAQKAAILSPTGQWPFYIALYGGKGSILGWLTFSNEVDGDITGPVEWFKLAQLAKFYPSGFTHEAAVAGSIYQFTSGVPVLNFTTGQVWLANGNLPQSFTNQIVLNTNKVVNLSSNTLTLTITTSSGLFKGSAVDPSTGKVIPISGILLQKQNFGAGFFLGTNETGRVYFGP